MTMNIRTRVVMVMVVLVMVMVFRWKMMTMNARTGVHQLNFTLIAGLGEGAAVFGRLQVRPSSHPFSLFLLFSCFHFSDLIKILLRLEEFSQDSFLFFGNSHSLFFLFPLLKIPVSFLCCFFLSVPSLNFPLVNTSSNYPDYSRPYQQ